MSSLNSSDYFGCLHPRTLQVMQHSSGYVQIKYTGKPFDPTTMPKFPVVAEIPCPCKQCINCRLDYSKQWRNRMLLEQTYHDFSYFLTLTYDDKHLPFNSEGRSSLRMDDFSGFMKRFRNAFPGKWLYYACSEYGTLTDRPHYHCILFGDTDLSQYFEFYKFDKHGFPLYTCPKLTDIWTFGYVTVSFASSKTMAYVSRYTAKKAGGFDPEGKDFNREPPASRMSLKPAIGLQYFLDHPEVISKDSFMFGNTEGSFRIRVPPFVKKYYLDALPPSEVTSIKLKHCIDCCEDWKVKLSETDLSTSEFFANQEVTLRKKYAALVRPDC